jgi:FkbM family methyltransferase
MIPKIIHYCWFGDSQMPQIIQDCIVSWKRLLPDYTFLKWSEDNYEFEHPFAVTAYEDKSWAFLVDYVRFDVLYKHGGIYLDTDMLLLKNLDIFLNHECFLGYEDEKIINCGIIGAEPNHIFIKDCLSIYDTLKFNNFLPPITSLITAILKRNTNYGIKLYSAEYFYPLPFLQKEDKFEPYLTSNSYAVHLWEASWLSEMQLLQNGFRKSALKKIRKDLKHNPIQPLRYYLRLALVLTPDKVKLSLKPLIKKIIDLGLSIDFFRNIIINSNISYSYRYYNFPTEKHFELNTIKTTNIDGIKYHLDIGEHNGLRVYFKIFSKSTWRLFDLIQPDFNIIDVGANIGFYTLNFAKKASKGNVFSFEPFPYNYQLLKKNISLNSFQNIQTFPIALGEKTQKISMNNFTDRNLGMVHISTSKNDSDGIEATTLDTFIKDDISKISSKIDLIKIDIEGYETRFINGAIDTLTKDYPILFIEVADAHLKRFNSSAYELIKKLESLGYNYIINAETGRILYSVFDFDDCFMDIICKKL